MPKPYVTDPPGSHITRWFAEFNSSTTSSSDSPPVRNVNCPKVRIKLKMCPLDGWTGQSNMVFKTLEPSGSISFPLRRIWNLRVQPKVSFFTWEAMWRRALTLDLVQKRGWSLANRCYMCHKDEKTIDHLLIHYVKTKVLWELLFTLFKVS